MKRNPYYIIKKIANEYYLVPFGQAIEALAPTVHVNEVTAFLWEELAYTDDISFLAKRLAEEYEVELEQAETLKDDVQELLRNLRKNRIIIDENTGNQYNKSEMSIHFNVSNNTEAYFNRTDDVTKVDSVVSTGDTAVGECHTGDSIENDNEADKEIIRILEIAGISISLIGRKEYFSKNFESFLKDMGNDESVKLNADICISVTEEEPMPQPLMPIALQGSTLTIYDGGNFYAFRTIELPMLKEAHFCKDGNWAMFYMDAKQRNHKAIPWVPWQRKKPTIEKETRNAIDDSQRGLTSGETDALQQEAVSSAECVFHAVRLPFLLKAQKKGMYVIHSASILHDGKAWLFSAPSGTGKSTHTKLWHKLWGTPYLDGDLNLLTFENEQPVVKGIPWCGTSGIFTTETYPLGGIILLVQDKRNYIEELSRDAQILGIQMRFITPKWTPEQTSESLVFAEQIAQAAKIARLHCNMDDEAAEVCRAWIDA